MSVVSFEFGRTAYRADFLVYAVAVAALTLLLALSAPAGRWTLLAGCVAAGLALWSLAEYGLHRWVLHRVRPFSRWHAEHHRRPTARIGTPTALSAALFVALVFLPAWLLGGTWPAVALLLGMLTGYLAYALTHHAVHHAAHDGAWLRRRRRAHARHHQSGGGGLCYGVTSSFWDRALGTLRR